MDIFLSRLHAEIRATRRTRVGATHNPQDVPTGQHKEYPRMPRIILPAPTELTSTLPAALAARKSYQRGGAATAFDERTLGTLFGLSLGMRDKSSRHYPSGGSLYPIETYLLGLTTDGRAPGAYHYHPRAHALEHLWDLDPRFSTHDITTTPGVPVGSALIVFTALWSRSSAKYGHLSYLHGALEAGHMAQNVLLTATALSLLSRPLAGFDDEKVATMLDLDQRVEQPVYAILVSTRVA